MDNEDFHAAPFNYYGDRYTYSQCQSEALRQHDLDSINWGNVAAEIKKVDGDE